MPIAQAGMGQGPTDPTAALLMQILSRPMPGVSPGLARMQAFMAMQQANPGRGPFTSIVNPIVSALMARQMGPQLQQQQADAAMQQRLKMFETVSKIQEMQTKGLFTKAQTDKLLSDMQLFTPQEERTMKQTQTGVLPNAATKERAAEYAYKYPLEQEKAAASTSQAATAAQRERNQTTQFADTLQLKRDQLTETTRGHDLIDTREIEKEKREAAQGEKRLKLTEDHYNALATEGAQRAETNLTNTQLNQRRVQLEEARLGLETERTNQDILRTTSLIDTRKRQIARDKWRAVEDMAKDIPDADERTRFREMNASHIWEEMTGKPLLVRQRQTASEWLSGFIPGTPTRIPYGPVGPGEATSGGQAFIRGGPASGIVGPVDPSARPFTAQERALATPRPGIPPPMMQPIPQQSAPAASPTPIPAPGRVSPQDLINQLLAQ
jgi:hypothetical protein